MTLPSRAWGMGRGKIVGMFSTLNVSAPARRRRGAAFASGLAFQFLMLGVVYLLGVLYPGDLSIVGRQHALVWLPDLAPPENHVAEPPHRVVRLNLPKPQPVEAPKLAAPPVAPLPEVPKVREAVTAPPVPPPPVMAPPQPAPALPVKAPMPIHTGLFGGAPEPVTTKLPARAVQTGGFGNPQGFRGQAQGDSIGTVPKLGSFGLPQGPGIGNGTGGSHGSPGVIASAGFGSAVAGTGDGRPRSGSGVSVGGFARTEAEAPPSGSGLHTPTLSPVQPVEILSKPNPVYTEEARRLGIQGEVTLSVVFEATGAIRVLGVVKSLGHGLDEAAQHAALQIRFKPALRDGKPADFPATLRIEFRLAGQPT